MGPVRAARAQRGREGRTGRSAQTPGRRPATTSGLLAGCLGHIARRRGTNLEPHLNVTQQPLTRLSLRKSSRTRQPSRRAFVCVPDPHRTLWADPPGPSRGRAPAGPRGGTQGRSPAGRRRARSEGHCPSPGRRGTLQRGLGPALGPLTPSLSWGLAAAPLVPEAFVYIVVLPSFVRTRSPKAGVSHACHALEAWRPLCLSGGDWGFPLTRTGVQGGRGWAAKKQTSKPTSFPPTPNLVSAPWVTV